MGEVEPIPAVQRGQCYTLDSPPDHHRVNNYSQPYIHSYGQFRVDKLLGRGTDPSSIVWP